MRAIKCIFWSYLGSPENMGKKTNAAKDLLAFSGDQCRKLVDHQKIQSTTWDALWAPRSSALPQFPVCSLILLLAEPPMGGVPGLNRHVDRNINKVPPPLPRPPHASSVDSCVLSCSLRSPMCANTHAHVGHLSWCTQIDWTFQSKKFDFWHLALKMRTSFGLFGL